MALINANTEHRLRKFLADEFDRHREPEYAKVIRDNADADDIIAACVAAMKRAFESGFQEGREDAEVARRLER